MTKVDRPKIVFYHGAVAFLVFRVRQLKTLANVGSLSHFVGMLTDSRSFLSFPRHEYFRRILCNLLGRWMTEGFVPDDIELIGGLAKRICYSNAKDYLGLKIG